MAKIILILGSSGCVGRHGAIAFAAAGWTVRAFDRKSDNLQTAATGADVILNAWNPPYTHWAKQVPNLTKQIIKAAKLSGSTVIIPGNVYVYGKGSPETLSATTPHAATNPLARIRIDMEQAYRDAGIPTIILCAGDYIDTSASGNWFDMIMIKHLTKGRFDYPGNPNIPHSFAYLPDVAKAMVQLAEKRDSLDNFADICFPGLTMTGGDIARILGAVTKADIQVKNMNWLPIQLARPFWPMAKHLLEMRYLWNMPHSLDDTQFKAVLPDFQMTSGDHALAQAVSFKINPDQSVVAGLASA